MPRSSEPRGHGSIRPGATHTGPSGWMVLLVVLAVAVLGFIFLLGRPPLDDEQYHLRVILAILGETGRPGLPMFPGYHFVIAGTSSLVGFASLDEFRLVSLVASLSSVGVFFLCARSLDERTATIRTLSFFFLPLLFPYRFLLYTNPFSVLLVLVSIAAYLRGWLSFAAIVIGGSIFVRQTNVVWLVMLFLMAYVDRFGWRFDLHRIREHLVRSWVFLLSFLAFGLFVATNHGLPYPRLP